MVQTYRKQEKNSEKKSKKNAKIMKIIKKGLPTPEQPPCKGV